MTFLDGAFLAGLLAAGIPVIIHLLHRRKAQPIRFPTLRFLEEAHVRTARRTRLTEILILALRTAAIALLALALARPVLHDAAAGSAGVSRVVVVDNSMSMSIRSGPATALERAKLAAIRIVRDLAPADRGAVLPLHHPSSGAFALTESKGRLESILSEITATHRSTPLVERIEDALRLVAGETSPVKQVLVFTDLQASAFGGTTAPLDWPEDVQLLFFRPRAAPVFNAAFGALDVESFGRDRPRVTARIRGLGAGSGSLRIRLLLDGSPSQERSMRLAAGAERSIALDLEGLSSGLHRARLEILGDALAEDDAIDTAVAAGEVLRVLVARDEDLARGTRDPAFYAARALRPRAGARRSIEVDAAFTRSLSERDLSGYHVIFLLEPRSLPRAAGQALAEFVEQGGGLFITASPVGIDPLFAELRLGARPIAPARLEARIDARSSPIHLAELLPEHPLWAPLLNASPPLRPEVPQLTWHRLATAAEDAEVLSSFSTRHPAFISRVEGRGRILLFTASFSDSGSNLPLRFLFAPLVDSIARYLAASRYRREEHIIGERWSPVFAPGGAPESIDVELPSGEILRLEIETAGSAAGKAATAGDDAAAEGAAEGEETPARAEDPDAPTAPPAASPGSPLTARGERESARPLPIDLGETPGLVLARERPARAAGERIITLRPDPAESDPAPLDEADLGRLFPGAPVILFDSAEDAAARAAAETRGTELRHPLLWLLLAVLLVEPLLANSTARRRAAEADAGRRPR